MGAITELGYVRFGVSDPAAWREFVTDLVGLELFQEPGSDSLLLRTDYWHHRIELVADDSDDLLTAGLRVAGRESFAELRNQLREAGVAVEDGGETLARERQVLEVMCLEDPAGTPIEIFHGPRIDTHRPFHPGRPMHGRFVTGSGGVGHMMLQHKGLQPQRDFCRLLGMEGDIEYRIPGPDGSSIDLMFMHCNDRDHTFAFGPPAKKRVLHLMLEVDNIDDVFVAYEKVQESQYPVVVAPGKHANDAMFSFYFLTPSGWQMEIGYSGAPATQQTAYHVRDTYGHQFLTPEGF